MRRQRRRCFVLGVVAITAAMAMMWRTPSTSYAGTADTASAGSVLEFSGSSDWVASIPQVYLSGFPVRWTPVNTDGVVWTPTVTRILRGQTYFAYFSLPNGMQFAVSEDDGTVWRIDNGGDYYDSSTWHLSVLAEYDPEAAGKWIADMIILIGKIIIVAILLVMFLLLYLMIKWTRNPPGRGKGSAKMSANLTQLDIGAWAGDTSGLSETYHTNPDFRGDVFAQPEIFNAGANLGIWSQLQP